jgi:hypothetical protein
MDSFGRLPTDVISMIKEFYQLPTISIIGCDRNLKLQITHTNVSQTIDLFAPLNMQGNQLTTDEDDLTLLYTFITQIKENMPCRYKSGFYDTNIIIYFTNTGTISIERGSDNIIINNDCVHGFVCAMEKYYHLLYQYPRWFSEAGELTTINMEDVPDEAWR